MARRSPGRAATGRCTSRCSISASTAGGPIRATGSTARRASRAIRMYWEGTQLVPARTSAPFALHRNGYRRHAALRARSSGRATSSRRWETLKTHVPVAHQHRAVSGIPYWGTDIGGFVPTTELHRRAVRPLVPVRARSARCSASHGRTWQLRLPWGWNTGELGPTRSRAHGRRRQSRPERAAQRRGRADLPEVSRAALPADAVPLHARCARRTTTGMPIMRALWLHYPDDPAAVARGDEYLWGRDILVAPVVEKGATSRDVYLPRGTLVRLLDRASASKAAARSAARSISTTMPLYVRAGAILPMGPVKQYTDEPVDGPLTLQVYPGADGAFTALRRRRADRSTTGTATGWASTCAGTIASAG